MCLFDENLLYVSEPNILDPNGFLSDTENLYHS